MFDPIRNRGYNRYGMPRGQGQQSGNSIYLDQPQADEPEFEPLPAPQGDQRRRVIAALTSPRFSEDMLDYGDGGDNLPAALTALMPRGSQSRRPPTTQGFQQFSEEQTPADYRPNWRWGQPSQTDNWSVEGDILRDFLRSQGLDESVFSGRGGRNNTMPVEGRERLDLPEGTPNWGNWNPDQQPRPPQGGQWLDNGDRWEGDRSARDVQWGDTSRMGGFNTNEWGQDTTLSKKNTLGKIMSRYDPGQADALDQLFADPDFQYFFPDAEIIEGGSSRDKLHLGDGIVVDVLEKYGMGSGGGGLRWAFQGPDAPGGATGGVPGAPGASLGRPGAQSNEQAQILAALMGQPGQGSINIDELLAQLLNERGGTGLFDNLFRGSGY